MLVSVGFAESHLDGHGGQPSQANGYGVMHLVSNPTNATLDEATKLTGAAGREARQGHRGEHPRRAPPSCDSYADQAGLADRSP